MAVLIIVSGIIAVIFTYIASYTLLPVEYDIHNSYNATTQRAQDILDQQHEVFVIMPTLFVGGIFFALYARAARRTQDDAGGGDPF